VTLSPASSVGAGLPLGLAGAVAPTRFVGGTTTGAPVAGTFQVGDFVITQDGGIEICTVAGSPGTWVAVSGGGGGLYNAVVVVRHEATQNTGGGTATSGAWRTRPLNVLEDPQSIASLASNQVTLPAATYHIRASAPFFYVDRCQIRLQDVTNAVTLVSGSSAYEKASGGIQAGIATSFIDGIFTLADAAALEIQYQVQTTLATQGLGVEANFGTEVYAVAHFERLA